MNKKTENSHDPLSPWPELRNLRDALLIRNPDAKIVGEAIITQAILAAALNMRLPDERLLNTNDAARLMGVLEEELFQFAEDFKVKPVKRTTLHFYWRAKDIYTMLDSLNGATKKG
jgi:propanediol dehydratase small subunit